MLLILTPPQYFKNCFVKECPICRGTIEGVQKGDNKVLVTADKLRAEFKQSCYSVRFKKVSHLVLVDPFEPPIEVRFFLFPSFPACHPALFFIEFIPQLRNGARTAWGPTPPLYQIYTIHERALYFLLAHNGGQWCLWY